MINGFRPQSLGGGMAGVSPMQTISSQRDSSDVMARRKLRDAVTKPYMAQSINGQGRVLTPFRAVNGLGHYRDNLYFVDGTENNQIGKTVGGRVYSGLNRGSTIPGGISYGTGMESSSGNRQYIASGAEYSNFKRLMAINANYNDLTFVGDASNGSQSALKAVHYGQVGFM
jgi:hypothetical protein